MSYVIKLHNEAAVKSLIETIFRILGIWGFC